MTQCDTHISRVTNRYKQSNSQNQSNDDDVDSINTAKRTLNDIDFHLSFNQY